MASSKKWTDEEVQYIKDNYLKTPYIELAKSLNTTYTQVGRKIDYMIRTGKLRRKKLKNERSENVVKKPRFNIPTCWDIGYGGCTIAHISMCIEEDFNQTLEELAARVAESKECPYDEALKVLTGLREQNRLVYYDKEMVPRLWRS